MVLKLPLEAKHTESAESKLVSFLGSTANLFNL
jgi:hypothetical protein